MGTFTLTQSQTNKNLYLYPNGDLCTEFADFGDSPNYACVDDDRELPDDDVTYVWWNGVAAAIDLYELQNHTTETGAINYVQIFARTKSHEILQHSTGVFKIICSPDSTCSHVYKSANKSLMTSYDLFSKVWTENPQDSLAWEWSDIDLLCPGVECSSPSIVTPHGTLTLRPNGTGVQTECIPVGDAPNWKCVDESVSDEDTTYNYCATVASKKDLFHLQNHTTETGTIVDITLYARYRKTGAAVSTGFKWWIYTNGGLRDMGFGTYPPNTYATFSKTLVINPVTSVAWTWADVDALQAGYIMNNDTTQTRVTQYYIIVTYEIPDVNPEIRTTQCYVKVNYDAGEVNCCLNKPQQISTNHARNIKMLNFWDGTREVYDLNRSGKSMVLTGSEVYSDSCDHIMCIRDMARHGNVVTISGLSLGYFNGIYRIRQFGWKKISEKPEHYKWILGLEDTEL
jgi:hypothetical protein